MQGLGRRNETLIINLGCSKRKGYPVTRNNKVLGRVSIFTAVVLICYSFYVFEFVEV